MIHDENISFSPDHLYIFTHSNSTCSTPNDLYLWSIKLICLLYLANSLKQMLNIYRVKAASLSKTSLQSTGKRFFQSSKPLQSSTASNPITSFPKTNPFAFQLLVATGKTSAADIVVQVVAERKKWDEIDWKRNGIFVVFGFACKSVRLISTSIIIVPEILQSSLPPLSWFLNLKKRFGRISILAHDKQIQTMVSYNG